MEYIVSCYIEKYGEFRYYLTQTITDGVTTYGVAIKSVNDGCVETVNDIWTEREPILRFIDIMAKNKVTLVHLKELCEEFVEELYSI